MKLKVNDYVKGVLCPFVHGKILLIEDKFATLDSGAVIPLFSLQKSTKKEVAALPEFMETLRNSKNGLNF